MPKIYPIVHVLSLAAHPGHLRGFAGQCQHAVAQPRPSRILEINTLVAC
jgi:hypothetical protein